MNDRLRPKMVGHANLRGVEDAAPYDVMVNISPVHKSFAIYPIDILHHRATILAIEQIEC